MCLCLSLYIHIHICHITSYCVDEHAQPPGFCFQVKKFQSMHNRAMERSELCAKLITATNSEVQLAPLLLAATGGACQLADCSHSLLCVPHRHCGARADITQIDAHVCVCIDSSIHRFIYSSKSRTAVTQFRASAPRGARAYIMQIDAYVCIYPSIHLSIDVSIHRNRGLQSLNAVRSTRAYACGARGAEATFLNVASSRFAHSVLARCLFHRCLLPRSILPRSCCIL
jgi:hypothetical protein